MDVVNQFAALISSVGFPIAACCVMFYLFNKFNERFDSIDATLAGLKMLLQAIDNDINKSKDVK